MADHNELGILGEDLAKAYLERLGYQILERNFVFQRAEIDIIAVDSDQLVFVEVKTRTSDYFGDPQDFVSPSKIKLIVKAAHEYIVSHDKEEEARFDIVAVLKNSKQQQIEHFKNAFYHF
ncbi:MAG: YraN family protein [Flavobacteriaceae bacterium]|nr:YraN family protein [Flavobacteriaceae bacterium]